MQSQNDKLVIVINSVGYLKNGANAIIDLYEGC